MRLVHVSARGFQRWLRHVLAAVLIVNMTFALPGTALPHAQRGQNAAGVSQAIDPAHSHHAGNPKHASMVAADGAHCHPMAGATAHSHCRYPGICCQQAAVCGSGGTGTSVFLLTGADDFIALQPGGVYAPATTPAVPSRSYSPPLRPPTV